MERAYHSIFERKCEERVAIITSEGEYITFKQLYQYCTLLALELEKRNCSKYVILYTGNTIEYAIGLFTIWMTDRTAVLADIRTKPEELQDFLDYFESDTIIGSPLLPINKNCCKNYLIPQREQRSKYSWTEKELKNELAIIFPTSGTTQSQKYVMLTHQGISEECESLKAAHHFCEATREIIVVPITSCCGSLGQLVPVLYSGGSLSLYNGEINMAKLRRTIRETRPNIIVCPPSLLSLIVRTNKSVVKDFDSVKIIVTVGETGNISLFDIAKEKFNLEGIIQAYGLTETSCQLSGMLTDITAPYESVGKILKNFEVRIKDGEHIMQANELGEIQVRGNSVTIGYFKNNKLTRSVFDDGWLRTGDLGYIDEQGYLYIKGRIKNIIIVSGKNVYAEEVEGILIRHPQIAAAYVYGEKSDVTGEKIIAEIVPQKIGSLDESMVREYCRLQMKLFMIPKEIHIVKELRLNASGKISRGNNK